MNSEALRTCVMTEDTVLDVDAAARASLLKMTVRRRRLIRLAERLLRPIVRLVGSRDPSPDSSEERPARILVIEYWNIGDVVILLPFLNSLRDAYPQARISLLANPVTRAVLAGQNLVDEIIPFSTPWSVHTSRWRKYNPLSPRWLSLTRSLLSLRRRNFDLVFTGRMDIRDNLLAWLTGATRRVGYGFSGGAFLLTDAVAPDLARPHRSQIWLQLLRHFGKPTRSEIPCLRLNAGEEAFAAEFLRKQGIGVTERLVGVHPGARISTRRWGTENFASVSTRVESKFRVRILWFGDPKEREEAQWLPPGWVRVRLPFREFLAVLARCSLLICNDSGPMHLATALGVPVAAVFGPQQPLWFGPRGPNDHVVIRPEFWCRPCSDYCIFDQPYCLRTISRDEVFTAASSTLHQLSVEHPNS